MIVLHEKCEVISLFWFRCCVDVEAIDFIERENETLSRKGLSSVGLERKLFL